MSRRIAVFTSSRGDLGPLGPVLSALDNDPRAELLVIAAGTHLTAAYGGRLADIHLSGESRLELLDAEINSTQPLDLGRTYGKIATGMSAILAQSPVDLLVLLGDRWELLAAAGTALIHGVPIAHLHGGETTEGAIDERIRHGITKLSDLHLCATEDSARRIRHLGEEAWRIVVTGAPGLDRLNDVTAMPDAEVEDLLGSRLCRPFGVVVYHPPTVDRSELAVRARAVLDASAKVLGCGVILYPGADPGSDEVIVEIEAALARNRHFAAHRNLGGAYLPMLKAADVLVGNSSSGIIEGASLHLPVVDVGERQRGRIRPRNVLHVPETQEAIEAGIHEALSERFRAHLAGLTNPYGDGAASQRIVATLLQAPLDRLLRKPLVETEERGLSLEAMTVRPGASLRDAMTAIDWGGHQIAFLVEESGVLIGSVSDGDVRRALLAGANMDDAVDTFVTRVPVVAEPEDRPQGVLALMERNSITQIPVVDKDGRLVGVHLMRALVADVLDSRLPLRAKGGT